MYRYFQKYGKVFMAVFSAVLMVGFALPSFRGGSMTGDSRVVGTTDGDKIYAQEAYNAQQAWDLLKRTRLGQGDRSVADVLGPTAVAQINDKPILFLLLQKEARKMGVTVSMDQLNSIIENTPAFKTGDADHDENMKFAVSQLMLVQQAFARATSVVKISEPMLQHQLGVTGQTITMSAVDFTGAQYASRVPPATPEQLKAQFERYSDLIRGNPNAANPFGFGYRYPNRIKFQYIAVDRAAVRKFSEDFSAPGKAKDPYEWEVETQKYYRQHQSEFPTSQPAAAPVDSRMSLDTRAARPTTQPFAAVHDKIREQLINEATEKRMAQIQERIVSVLAADWVVYHNAVDAAGAKTNAATTQPGSPSTSTTAAALNVPASSLGVAYNSVDYLQKLAGQIQSAYGVLPKINSIADNWMTSEEIAKVPGVGQAMLVGTDPPFPAAQYLMNYAVPFLPPDRRTESNALQVFEPTRPMQDSAGVMYIARISAADLAHKPATLAEVEPQVRADVTNKAAYDLAKADADKLLDAARKSDLKSAAGGKSVLSVGPLTFQPGGSIPGLLVSEQETGPFLTQAFKLISTPTSRPSGKPVELIELQPDGRVLVAELAHLQAMWTDRSKPIQEAQTAIMLKNDLDARFGAEWFDFRNAAARVDYVPAESGKNQDAANAPEQPAAPIF